MKNIIQNKIIPSLCNSHDEKENQSIPRDTIETLNKDGTKDVKDYYPGTAPKVDQNPDQKSEEQKLDKK